MVSFRSKWRWLCLYLKYFIGSGYTHGQAKYIADVLVKGWLRDWGKK
jgi:hypothetical protein